MRKALSLSDMQKKKWGELTVIAESKPKGFWKVRCSCGTEKVVRGSALRSGNTKSCGCIKARNTGRPPLVGMRKVPRSHMSRIDPFIPAAEFWPRKLNPANHPDYDEEITPELALFVLAKHLKFHGIMIMKGSNEWTIPPQKGKTYGVTKYYSPDYLHAVLDAVRNCVQPSRYVPPALEKITTELQKVTDKEVVFVPRRGRPTKEEQAKREQAKKELVTGSQDEPVVEPQQEEEYKPPVRTPEQEAAAQAEYERLKKLANEGWD